MSTSWAENPDDRQTFSQLKSNLGDMLLESRQYIQFSDADIEAPLGYDHLAAVTDDPSPIPQAQLLAADPTLSSMGQQRLSWNTRLPASVPLADIGSDVNFTGESGFSEQHSTTTNAEDDDHAYARSVANRYVLTPHKQERFGFGVRNEAAESEIGGGVNDVSFYDKAEEHNVIVVKQENGAVLNNVTEETSHEPTQSMPYDHLETTN